MATDVEPQLRSEILNLFQYVQRLKKEIAAIANRSQGQTAFESMSDQLDAIVAATGGATFTILENLEGIEDVVRAIREHPAPEELDALCDKISERSVGAMEACSFQDISGQRVTKIIKSVRFIEERVNALALLWGQDEIEALAQQLPGPEVDLRDGVPLEGPQLAGAAISQDDIDKLFD